MGLYQNNLKRTLIGYQFDHPVYVGTQINDNRLVTYKEIGHAVSSMIQESGAAHVSYTLSATYTTANGLQATIKLQANGVDVPGSVATLTFTYDSTNEALVIDHG